MINIKDWKIRAIWHFSRAWIILKIPLTTEKFYHLVPSTSTDAKKMEVLVTQLSPTLSNPMVGRFLRPWDFLGKNTGVGCHFLLQGIFLVQAPVSVGSQRVGHDWMTSLSPFTHALGCTTSKALSNHVKTHTWSPQHVRRCGKAENHQHYFTDMETHWGHKFTHAQVSGISITFWLHMLCVLKLPLPCTVLIM